MKSKKSFFFSECSGSTRGSMRLSEVARRVSRTGEIEWNRN